jgi:hypothetical protein
MPARLPAAVRLTATPAPVANAPVAGAGTRRGFSGAPDGTLYPALAGRGGETHLPVIPGYTIDVGLTSSVVSVAIGGMTPVAQGLASVLWEEPGWLCGAMIARSSRSQIPRRAPAP